MSPSSATTPATADLRAGAAASSGVKSSEAAPALAAALAPKSHGSSSRASLQTGIAVFAIKAPVYVASGGPERNDIASASHFTGRSTPSSSSAAAVFEAPPETTRIQLPTLIGDVTLNILSMFKKRSGRPRSEMRRIGDAASATAPTYSALFARRSLPVTRAMPWRTEDAPAIPPVQK